MCPAKQIIDCFEEIFAQWLSVTSPWDLCRTSVPTERLPGIFFRKYLFRHHTAERADQNLREERMEERLRISAPGGSDPHPKFRMSPSAPLHPPRAASLAPDPLRPLRAGQTPRDIYTPERSLVSVGYLLNSPFSLLEKPRS